MKILVPIKSVIDQNTQIRIKPDNSAINTDDSNIIINHYCKRALEEAISMKETGKASEVIALTLGTEKDKKILFSALAMGADRAILIKTDKRLNSLIIAKLIKEIALKEKPQIIITGRKSIDSDNSQTGQMIAGLLDWGQATFAIKIDIINKDYIRVTREIERGTELIELKIPCVITANANLNSPRYVSKQQIDKIKKQKTIEELSIDSLNINTHSKNKIIRTDMNPRRSLRKEAKTVEELVELLKEEAKVI